MVPSWDAFRPHRPSRYGLIDILNDRDARRRSCTTNGENQIGLAVATRPLPATANPPIPILLIIPVLVAREAHEEFNSHTTTQRPASQPSPDTETPMSSLPPALDFAKAEEAICAKWAEEGTFKTQDKLGKERGDEVRVCVCVFSFSSLLRSLVQPKTTHMSVRRCVFVFGLWLGLFCIGTACACTSYRQCCSAT